MGISLVKIRATVSIGSLSVSTPYIQSFSVTKTRNQVSTFSASLKVAIGEISGVNTGGPVTIDAGTSTSKRRIFTGIIKTMTMTPCWENAKYVYLNISGVDILFLLENKKYTRRCRTSKTSWVMIDRVEREGLRSGKFGFDVGVLSIAPSSMLPSSANPSDPLRTLAKNIQNTPGEPVPEVAITYDTSTGEVV